MPVINKIDLPAADPERVAHEIEDVIGIPALDAPRISAKTGLNVEEVLERIVTDIPGPLDTSSEPLRALIFDSYYDSYRGVIVYIRLVDGKVKPGDRIRMMATGAEFSVVEVGHMGATSLIPCGELTSGEVGYLTASIKSVADTRVGYSHSGSHTGIGTAARLPQGQSHGLFGYLSGGRRQVSRSPGRSGKAAAQRCGSVL